MTGRSKKPPKLAEWLLYFAFDESEREIFIGDFAEFYNEIYKETGPLKAGFWYFRQVLISLPKIIKNLILLLGEMLQKNNLDIKCGVVNNGIFKSSKYVLKLSRLCIFYQLFW